MPTTEHLEPLMTFATSTVLRPFVFAFCLLGLACDESNPSADQVDTGAPAVETMTVQFGPATLQAIGAEPSCQDAAAHGEFTGEISVLSGGQVRRLMSVDRLVLGEQGAAEVALQVEMGVLHGEEICLFSEDVAHQNTVFAQQGEDCTAVEPGEVLFELQMLDEDCALVVTIPAVIQ
jgi:hypothetical protein